MWHEFRKDRPENSGIYLVIKTVHNQPTVAIYNHVINEWAIMISGQYWQIKGVQYWMEKPAHPTKKKHE